MRAIFESGFYYLYLISIISIGIFLLIKKKNIYFAIALIVLGLGDAFHLIPRAIGLYTKTLDNPSETLNMWLGLGKLITSITMTIFYVFLYMYVYARIKINRSKSNDIMVMLLLVIRIALLCLPQNRWLTNDGALWIGIVRNIPFLLLGIFDIYLLIKYLRKEKYYKTLYIATILSFAFYIPVVVFASKYSWVGMLMLPKTICYLWIGVLALLDGIKSHD